MVTWTPDPTFYPSPRLATQAPPEKLAYVASFDPTRRRPDAMAVVNLDPVSANYGQIVGQTDLAIGDELHHFGWNACSSCLCPNAPHPHVERRYLIVPGIRSSRLHVLDTKPDPAHPKLIRTIEADELAKRAGYSRPHTVHCGPEGIYISALADGHRDGGRWAVTKVISIPAEPAESDQLPPMLKDFKACPPFVTDIDLSVDDQYLYVSCWGTGDFHQYDVSDPFKPKLTGKLRNGGMVSRAPHPKVHGPLNGGPQMVEVSRDGRRIYFTNSLYSAVDDQFYPDGIKGWMVKVNAKPEGGIEFDEDFFLSWPDGYLPHQVRLQGGDASSDSYCYP
jgi:hypothetical protein